MQVCFQTSNQQSVSTGSDMIAGAGAGNNMYLKE